MPDVDVAAHERALAALAKFPTTTDATHPESIRSVTLFGRSMLPFTMPLNRKTTQSAIVEVQIATLEPSHDLIPVGGLEAYIVKPRNDPPDVAHVVMYDGAERYIILEGHTRLGAAKLRGENLYPVRLWEFQQGADGSIAPIARGRHARGERYRDKLLGLISNVDVRINLPDIADVSFPSLIGAIPSKPPRPRKKRKKVQYHGVTLSRAPMKFEVKVLSLAEIPPRLDAAVMKLTNPDAALFAILADIAHFGSMQVLHELVRQGATETILRTPPDMTKAVKFLTTQTVAERRHDLDALTNEFTAKLSRRKISDGRRQALLHDLVSDREPAIYRRHANYAVNGMFALSRALTIQLFRRKHDPFMLAYQDETGQFISKADAVAGGDVIVDKVIQTAVMDTNTCDPCADVDGEEMEFGDDRQQELHPPYVKCLGGNRCRCVQIAILSDGSEVEVDELDEDTIP